MACILTSMHFLKDSIVLNRWYMTFIWAFFIWAFSDNERVNIKNDMY